MMAKMMNWRRLWRTGLAAALLGLSLTAVAQDKPAAAVKPPNPVLWELKSGKHTVYLFGSIHMAKSDFYPLPDKIEEAYRKSERLVVELDPTAPDIAFRMAPFISYAPPDNLEKHLSAPTWQKLVQRLGPSTEQVKMMKPSMLSAVLMINLFSTEGYAPQAGIDLHFISQAKADKKPIQELETIEFQAGVLGNLADADGEAMLQETLDGFDNGEGLALIDAMATAWKKGDAQGLADLFVQEAAQNPSSARVMKALIDDRNPEMTRKVAALSAEGKDAFVVVGMGHLVGPEGIVQLLRKRGLTVQRVH
jgi:uncharacterized protein YbaP (TraB family)